VPASVPCEAGGNPGDALLVVEHLSVELPGRQDRQPVPVVTDISFVIGRGETVALLGESGCGKTITALAVLGLLPAGGRVSGRVLLDGQDLTAAPARAVAGIRGRRIGYIAQDPMTSLDPVFTVGSQVAEAVRCHTGYRRAGARRRAVSLLDSVKIREPDLLIADEPTTALDVTIQAEILTLMRRLALERGMSLLLVTHDWAVAASVADRALVMYAGQLAEEAPAAVLFAAPAHPYTRGLLASAPQLAVPGQRLRPIPGQVPAPGGWPAGCRFASRCPEAGRECRHEPVQVRAAAPGHAARCVHVSPAGGTETGRS
jgi:peptide/nickel transport system permease protein